MNINIDRGTRSTICSSLASAVWRASARATHRQYASIGRCVEPSLTNLRDALALLPTSGEGEEALQICLGLVIVKNGAKRLAERRQLVLDPANRG